MANPIEIGILIYPNLTQLDADRPCAGAGPRAGRQRCT